MLAPGGSSSELIAAEGNRGTRRLDCRRGRHPRPLLPRAERHLARRSVAGAGWEIGSHTRSHPHLPALPPDSLEEELKGSRERLEDALGLPCRSIAYPYGDVNRRVVRAAERAGYEAAGTLRAWELRRNPL